MESDAITRDGLQKRPSISLQLRLADAGDEEGFLLGLGAVAGEGLEGLVGEDDVEGDVLALGDAVADVLEDGVELGIEAVVLQGHGGARAGGGV